MKPLPFRGWRKKYVPMTTNKEEGTVSGNYYISSNWESIIKILKL